MERDTALVLIIAVALLVVAFQTFQLVGLTNTVKTTGLATAPKATGSSSQSEYDKMMQEMHPDQPVKQINSC